MPRLSLLVAISAAACGQAAAPVSQASAPVPSAVAPPVGPDDLEVARVGGRPVWGSCVAGQVARGAPTRQVALDECITFELLAQHAEQRGLATDPMVQEATRQALVSQLIAREFEAKVHTTKDLGPAFDDIVTKNAWRMNRPDLRASAYVRAKLPPEATPAEEAAARATIDEVAQRLAGETGLLGPALAPLVDPIGAAHGIKLEITDVPPGPRTKWVPTYGDALHAIPEVGRASGPVRTKWGWEVVVWTGGLPPRTLTREQLAAEMFPELRRGYFDAWAAQIAKASGVQVSIDEAQLAHLDEVTP